MNKYYLIILLITQNFFSQNQIQNLSNETQEKINSPQVHLLKQFGDQPVEISRGMVDVNVPFYEINFDKLKIPLGIQFHPSGLKANAAENGILGLKWALNIGGFVSREVRGYPDERTPHKQGITNEWYMPDWMTSYGGTNDNGYNNNNVIFQTQDLTEIGMPGVYGKYEDTEYDVFTFSLPNGQSGKFLLKDINGEKTSVFLPYKALKANIYSESLYDSKFHITQIEIIDDSGYSYKFGKNDSNKAYYETDQEYYSINCWYLNSITSPNKKETIKFDYVNSSANGNSPLNPIVVHDQLTMSTKYYTAINCGNNSVLFDSVGWDLYLNYFVKNYNMSPYGNREYCYLTKITYNDLIINFNHRADLNDINYNLLDNIEVTRNNEILKKINFTIISPGQSNISELPKPSYLQKVQIRDKEENLIEKYDFDYYNLNQLPQMTKLANSADYWGYYNSQVENVILKDTISIYFAEPTCSGVHHSTRLKEAGSNNSRFSNAEDMKIGMIKSITYPTGGKTIFEYDANQYRDYGPLGTEIKNCGGLRIKSLFEIDKNGTEIKRKTFVYGENGEGVGELPGYLKPDSSVINEFEEKATEWYIDDRYVFLNGLGNPVGFRNESADVSYKTRYYTGFFPARYYTFLDRLVYYNKVTEYNGGTTNNIGKTEHYFSYLIPQKKDYDFNLNNFSYKSSKCTIDPSNFWVGNHLDKKIAYKNENGNYIKVKETEYFYQENIVDQLFDVSLFNYKTFTGFYASQNGNEWKSTSPIIAKVELERIRYQPGDYFGSKTQKYNVGVENLTQTIEKLYLKNNDSIVQMAINTFDLAKPTFLKERTIINSKGENITQKFSYPFNINTGTYSQMTTANLISPVIENLTLNNNKVTGSELLTYKKSDDNFVPDKNYISHLSNPVPFSGYTVFNGSSKDSRYSTDPENSYDAYDNHGNPIQISSKSKGTIVYIWGYNKDYPIAKIENATYTVGQLNTISPVQQTLINDAVAAAEGETTPATEANLRNKLQLLRAGFPDAMVSTFTYDPLIGITSMTDPKSYTIYYEYDSYGRLKQVKDKEGKVLSANNYRYNN